LPFVLVVFYSIVMNDHPASWRMPKPKEMEKLARDWAPVVDDTSAPAPSQSPPADWWESVLADPRAAGKPWLPIQQMRLSEIPRELLRVECARCSRCVEIQRLDAIKLCGPHAVWKDVGQRLLDDGCQIRTGELTTTSTKWAPLAEIRRLAPREGWCYHHVQAIIGSIDQSYGIGGSKKDDSP
jgi:hypothetical protein